MLKLILKHIGANVKRLISFTILSYNIELNLNQVKLKQFSTLIQTNHKNIELVLKVFSGIQVALTSLTLRF